VKVWVEAARPRTLPAGIVPVIVGTAATHRLVTWRFLAALVVGASVQVGVNYANDYYDGVKGVDTAARSGPRRATAAGLVTPASMRTAMLIAFGVAGLAGGALAIAVQPLLVLVGAACFAAALGYSGGPRPYASIGLGEVFVFLFFGLVATVGSAYVQDGRITLVALTAALPVGLLAVAILMVNNLRDAEADQTAGKITLAVRMGPRRGRRLYDIFVLAAVLSIGLVAAADHSMWPLLALVAMVPLAARPRRLVAQGALTEALGSTAQLELVAGTALAVGLWLS
jgi:1,4-dihydroxy-2-naphthoate polyprenyltransferase